MLVDLRHEATHNELPSLPLLRTAAHHALAWLHTSYWQAQQEQLAVCTKRCRQLLQVSLRVCPHARSPCIGTCPAHRQPVFGVARTVQLLLRVFAATIVWVLWLQAVLSFVPGLVRGLASVNAVQALAAHAAAGMPVARQRQQRVTLQELKGLVPSAAAALLVRLSLPSVCQTQQHVPTVMQSTRAPGQPRKLPQMHRLLLLTAAILRPDGFPLRSSRYWSQV